MASIDNTILVAAISACSAITGALISQAFSIFKDWLDKKHKRNTLLREKYEEFAGFVLNSEEWTRAQMSSSSLRELRNNAPTAAQKAVLYSHLYFPELRTFCEKYLKSCANFQTVLIDNHQFDQNTDIGTQAIMKNESAVISASKQLNQNRYELQVAIINFASKYTKA